MKDPAYRTRCIDKVLSKYSGLEVMDGLADIALDIFEISLRDEKKPVSMEEIKRQIRELEEWKRTTLRD